MAVVIIADYGTMEVAISALKSRAQDFLLKTFTLEELVERINRLTKRF